MRLSPPGTPAKINLKGDPMNTFVKINYFGYINGELKHLPEVTT